MFVGAGFGLVVLLLGYGLWFAGCFCVSRVVVALTAMLFVGVGGVVGVAAVLVRVCSLLLRVVVQVVLRGFVALDSYLAWYVCCG